jgi:hypothetical protein
VRQRRAGRAPENLEIAPEFAAASSACAVAMKAAPFAGNIYQQNRELRATSGITQALAFEWLPTPVQIRNCLEIIQQMIFF